MSKYDHDAQRAAERANPDPSLTRLSDDPYLHGTCHECGQCHECEGLDDDCGVA